MDFWRTVLVIFRRWYISVPAFFATLALAGAAYSAVPVQYQSGSVLVLTTPLAGGTQATDGRNPTALTNPLLTFDRSLALTASIVIQQMNSSESARRPGIVPGGATDYQVTNGSTNPELLESGPFLFVEGTGPTPEAARDVVARASAMATEVLAQRQDEPVRAVHLRRGNRTEPPGGSRRRRTGRLRGIRAPRGAPDRARRAGVHPHHHPGRRPADRGTAVAGQLPASVRRRRRAGGPGEPRGRLRLREPDDPPSAAPSGTRAGGHTCRHGADDTPDNTGDGVAMTLVTSGRRVRRSPPTHASRGLAGPRTPPRSWGSSSRSSSCCRRGWSSTTCRSPCQRRRWSRSGSAPCGSAPR